MVRKDADNEEDRGQQLARAMPCQGVVLRAAGGAYRRGRRESEYCPDWHRTIEVLLVNGRSGRHGRHGG